MDVNQTPVSDFGALDAQLRSILGVPGTTLDQVVIQVGSGLRYEDLMRVIEVCTWQRLSDGTPLSKLSFTELQGG